MPKEDLEKHSEITDVTFDHEGAHLAQVHKLQGGAANGWHQSLVLKANELDADIIKALEQVEVKLSFEEFLRKFMYMYSSDAEVLAKLLGYTTEYEQWLIDNEMESDAYIDFLDSQIGSITLLKSSTTIDDIPKDELLSVVSLQKSFESGVEQLDLDLDNIETEIEKSSDENLETTDNQEEITQVDIKELLKSAEAQEALQEMVAEQTKVEVEKATADLAAELEAKESELVEKSEKLEGFLEIEAKRTKDGFTNLVKSLTFIDEADQEQAVEVLVKAKDSNQESVAFLIQQLEKAQVELDKAKTEFVESEDGVEAPEEDSTDVEKASDLEALAEKYAGRDWL